jgi:hypothetical protein
VAFLLSETPPATSPFPILASDRNRHRHDPWDAIALHHIFRDPWERKFPLTKPEDTRCVVSTGDYPELEDMFDELNSFAEDYPETEFIWSMEQQAFPGMPNDDAAPEADNDGDLHTPGDGTAQQGETDGEDSLSHTRR